MCVRACVRTYVRVRVGALLVSCAPDWSRQLRVALEQAFGKSLKEYKSFIDQQVCVEMAVPGGHLRIPRISNPLLHPCPPGR